MTARKRKELRQRVEMAYVAAGRLTQRTRLQFRVARLLLASFTTAQIAALAGWKKYRS